MCGIGGIIRIGKRPIRKWQLQQLATELQHRGTDATGFAIMDANGDISVWKMASPAWKAVSTSDFHNWCDKALTDRARILLVHTRAYTKGSPHISENNHPLYATPLEGVIVHNGMVRNDDGLFEVNKKLKGFKRSCVTDSDVFRAILDNHGGVDKALIKEMRIVDGTAAVAAFHRATPGKLLLLRDSNPLVLGATQDTLAFASTKEALHKILKPWVDMHNIPMQVHSGDLSFVAMRNETGYIIGPNGLESHDEFKCNGKGYGGYVKYGKTTSYWDKQAKAMRDATQERPKVDRPLLAPSPDPVGNGVAYPHVTTLNPENVEAKPSSTPNGQAFLNPTAFEYTICPNDKCNKHVELSVDDRRLSSLALLACKSCGTNLADGQNADLKVN